MNRWKMLLAAGMALQLATSAVAKDNGPPLEPAQHPDWAKVREQGESELKKSLFDPTSAQITWTSGFAWGWLKPIFGKKQWGWVACGDYNAKNRMGGYAGRSPLAIAAWPDGRTTVNETGQDASCYHVPTPLQPELAATAGQSSGGQIIVADELGKLADLKARGIITQAEFDAQKSKLLAR